MANRILQREDWQSYCDRISKGVAGQLAYVAVAGLAMGDRAAANWLPLLGVVYDAKDDLLEIAMDGLDHLIKKPGTIAVDDCSSALISMEIVDSDRRRHIVTVMPPLLLSPPARRAP